MVKVDEEKNEGKNDHYALCYVNMDVFKEVLEMDP